jgi:hypothetical protein
VITENFGCLRKTSVAEGANSRTIWSNHFPLPRPMSRAPSGLGGGNLRNKGAVNLDCLEYQIFMNRCAGKDHFESGLRFMLHWSQIF